MKFMITIALFKELGSYGIVTTTEVSYVRRGSGESNKLRYTHSIRGTPRDIAVKERNNVKIEIVPFIIKFSGNRTINNNNNNINISFFQENNIFGTNTSLTYGPQLQR